MRTEIRPTGVARTFGSDELIVSKTDVKGRITYANDVFLRVSGYAREEVIGQPHNLVRHPDSPAGLFRVLWTHIQQGQEIFAYINNLAKNGDHYWVLAHVTPTRDQQGRISGFHSNRRLPDPGAIRGVTALYDKMRAAEAHHRRSAEAVAAGEAVLVDELERRGQTYSELVWQLICGGTPAMAGGCR